MKRVIICVCICVSVCVFYIFYNTSKTNQITTFVSNHGNDDYSIFERVTLIFRGRENDVFLIGGLVPAFQGDSVNIEVTALYYSQKDSVLIKIEREKSCIDSVYATKLTKKFIELGIYSIYVDNFGTIEIQLSEKKESLVVKFNNDSILDSRKWEMDWKNISGKWYVPVY